MNIVNYFGERKGFQRLVVYQFEPHSNIEHNRTAHRAMLNLCFLSSYVVQNLFTCDKGFFWIIAIFGDNY